MNERQLLKHQRTRQNIIQAAHELIQENGYNRLSLRAIAKRVQYAPASLYEYFDNKDAIIDALSDEINVRLSSQMRQETKLVEMAWQYVAFALENSDDFQLLYQRPLLASQEEKAKAIFFGAIQVRKPNLPKQALEAMVYALWATAHGIALLALSREYFDSVDDKEYHCQALQIIVDNIENFSRKEL